MGEFAVRMYMEDDMFGDLPLREAVIKHTLNEHLEREGLTAVSVPVLTFCTDRLNPSIHCAIAKVEVS